MGDLHRWAVCIGIPLTLLGAGAIGKKLARGKGWKKKDVNLGGELLLSAAGVDLTLIADFLYAIWNACFDKDGKRLPAVKEDELVATVGPLIAAIVYGIFLIAAFAMYTGYQQEYDENAGGWRHPLLFDAIGFVLLATSFFIMKSN